MKDWRTFKPSKIERRSMKGTGPFLEYTSVCEIEGMYELVCYTYT